MAERRGWGVGGEGMASPNGGSGRAGGRPAEGREEGGRHVREGYRGIPSPNGGGGFEGGGRWLCLGDGRRDGGS